MKLNPRQPLDRKGILAFLAITFGLTWAVEGVLLLLGVRFELGRLDSGGLVVALMMLSPGLAAFITLKFITREGFGQANLRLGPWRPYLALVIFFPACYLVIYLITWGAGLGQPDWMLNWFQNLMAGMGAPMSEMPPPALIFGALFVASLGPGALFSTFFAFGEELGWRGFLLPKLMPLGKPAAYALMALIWSAWHWPLILGGFTYPGYPLLGLVFFTALTATLGTFLNELTLRYRSCILASWGHALFNTQKQGIWFLLFPTVNPLLGGYAGLIGLALWTALAAATVGFYRRR